MSVLTNTPQSTTLVLRPADGFAQAGSIAFTAEDNIAAFLLGI